MATSPSWELKLSTPSVVTSWAANQTLGCSFGSSFLGHARQAL